MDLPGRISAIAASDPYQMSAAEYAAVAAELTHRGGCNLLVFGVGNDSPLWVEINADGVTLFVESSPAWAERVAATLPPGGWQITPHDYGTRVGDGLAVVGHSLPAAVTSRTWDVILVDGPRGVDADDPGRVVPIRAAATLAKRDGWRVFVHDCDRPLERAACRHFFGREPARAYDRTWAYGADHDRPL